MTNDRRHVLALLAGSVLMTVAGNARAGQTPPASEGDGIVGADSTADAAGAAPGDETLKGQVLTYGGKPVFGASVSFQSLDNPPQAVPDIAQITGEDGGFGAVLPPGHYRVTVMSPAGAKKSRDTSVQRGQLRSLRLWLPN